MKLKNVNISNVACVVFKSSRYKLYENTGEVARIVKTVKWERKPATALSSLLPDDYNEEYAWVCVNARIDGVQKPDHRTLGAIESDSDMIRRLKRLNHSPRYDFWYNHPTLNIEKR